MTAMGRAAMARPDRDFSHGEGERREAAMRRKRYLILGSIFAAGLVTGFYVGFKDAEGLFGGGGGVWSPAASLALAALYLIALIGGSLLLKDQMDEHDRQVSYKAASLGAVLMVGIYPPWFLLWKGGLAVEPSHLVLYIIFIFGMAGGMLWYRFR